MTSRPEPGTPEWCALVTASKVPALLGLSPWDSPLSMWLKMAGRAPWDAESQAMRRGNIMRMNGIDAELLSREAVMKRVPVLDYSANARFPIHGGLLQERAPVRSTVPRC